MAAVAPKVPEFVDPGIDKLKINFWLPVPDPQVQSMLIKRGHSVVFSPKQYFDAVLFTGGADVHPILYGEKLNDKTRYDLARDMKDSQAYHSLYGSIPKVGICRGAQFLNVKSGGRMYQHVDNHGISGTHVAMDGWTNKEIKVTSTHHQMMRPNNDAEILLYSDISTSRATDTSTIYPAGYEEFDTEACFYADTNSFCFQPHPENANSPEECTNYFFDKIHELYWIDILRRRKTVRDHKKE